MTNEELFDWARQFQRPPCDHHWVEIVAVGVGIISRSCTKCGESQCVHEWVDKKPPMAGPIVQGCEVCG